MGSGTFVDLRARGLPFERREGRWNMAADAFLLAEATRPTLRLYGWSVPTVSLGRFQGRQGALEHVLGFGLPVVWRMTGGGAIIHAEELTYAVLLPLDHELIRGLSIPESYAAVHAPIETALGRVGVTAHARDDVSNGGPSPVLCFQRTTSLDLVAGPESRKLVGSAQRRTHDRLLQHGSILLEPHPLQPGTASVSELALRSVPAEELAQEVSLCFEGVLGPLAFERPNEAEEAAIWRLRSRDEDETTGKVPRGRGFR